MTDARTGPGNVNELEGLQRDSLHLAVSDACNNSCIFCLNGRVDGRIEGVPPHPPTFDEIRHILDRGYEAGLREALITIAEPTLGPHLVPAVAYARKIGFNRVGMNTNGRRLAKDGLIDRLIDAGMNQLMLSVHGASPEVHDPLVGRSGAFREVEAGMERLAVIRPASGFRLSFLSVLCRQTMPHIEDMYRFFRRFSRPVDADHISYTCWKAMGSACGIIDLIGATYSELVDEWLRVWRALDTPSDMMLSEVPGCVVIARGGDGPLPSIDVPDTRHLVEGEGGTERVRGNVGGDDNYARRSECDACLLGTVCWGAMKHYVERFGWDEFPPVTRLPELRSLPGAGGRGDPSAGWTPVGLSAFASRVFGIPPDALARSGMVPLAARLQDGEIVLEAGGADGFLLTLRLAPRDPARPAYLRTAHLNVSYSASRDAAVLPRLFARMARHLADARFEDLAAAWGRRGLPADGEG